MILLFALGTVNIIDRVDLKNSSLLEPSFPLGDIVHGRLEALTHYRYSWRGQAALAISSNTLRLQFETISPSNTTRRSCKPKLFVVVRSIGLFSFTRRAP
jgi:hypothetical protein